MKANTILFVLSAALLAACQPAAPASTASTASGTTPAATASATPASFSVDSLGDNEWSIQGCQTMITRVGLPENQGIIFAEDAVDTGAHGFIKINGNVLNVALVSTNGSEASPEVRTFADAAHTVQVVESPTLGKAHEEADSVERAGTLAVTFGGATQTIQVDGGTAC